VGDFQIVLVHGVDMRIHELYHSGFEF